jgi:alkylation response protein AidB-like acyl-CoA dehydrogenase
MATHLQTPDRPRIADGDAAIALARTVLPRIAADVARVDRERHVAPDTVAAIKATGLFNIVTPRSLGGSELGFADLVRVTAEFAATCGSTGWVYGVLAGHSWLLNLFPAQAQADVFADPDALIATVFRLGGQVQAVEGGYRLTGGDGRFCSGIDFADWVIVGNGVAKPDGSFEPRFFVVPRAEIEVVDDWHTIGMRGTGSRTIRIADAFIPAHRSVSLAEMLSGRSPGGQLHDRAIYHMPFADIAPFSIIGAPLGVARGIVQRFADELGQKLAGADDVEIGEQAATYARIAGAAADIDAALALVLDDARMIDTARRPEDLSPLDRARIPRDWAWAAQTSRYAATRVFEASGGTAIYDGHALQRMWRDVNGAAQHFAFTWDAAMAGFGRVACGIKPSAFALKPRRK